jgi:hypothetical protein
MPKTGEHVEPFEIKAPPGAAPGGGLGLALDLGRWMPLILKMLDLFKTGKGYLSTTLPAFGKRYLILSDTLPEEFQ